MNPGGHDGPRRPTLPPPSTRTLRHPSFMPVFMGADYRLTDCSGQTLLPIIPAELFYTDPTMSCGQRVPNVVSELQVLVDLTHEDTGNGWTQWYELSEDGLTMPHQL